MSGSRVEYIYCCAYRCRRCIAGDLVRTAKTQLLPQERDTFVVKRDLRCLPWALHMHTHRSWTIPTPSCPRAMGHRRCVEGYDHASKGCNEKQRGTILDSETTSLAPGHMTYSPPRPTASSHRTMDIPCRAAMAPWSYRNPRCPKRALQLSRCFL